MLVSRRAGLALVTLGALALAGCGGGSSGSSDSAKAGQKGEQASGTLALLRSDAKGSLEKAADAIGKGKTVTITVEGLSAGKKVTMRGAMTTSKPATGEIVMDDGTSGPTTIRMVGTTVYTQIPAKDRAEMDGKSWMKMDIAKDAGGRLGRQFDDMDPSKQLKSLVSGNLTVVGEESVGGVKTVHYKATAPLSVYLATVDPAVRAQAEKVMTSQGVKEIKSELWIDEQYLTRRIKTGMGNTDLDVHYSDYGKPVDVTAPPAAETYDFAEMMKNLKSGITG